MCFPLPRFSDIRYNFALAGGALMDAGCYAVHMARTFGGSTPEVVSAQAKLRPHRMGHYLASNDPDFYTDVKRGISAKRITGTAH